MYLQWANNAESTLLLAALVGDGTITIAPGDAAKFPSPIAPQIAKVTVVQRNTGAREIMHITARAANVLSVVRAQEATAALAFAINDIVSMRMTRETLDVLQQHQLKGVDVPSANDITLNSFAGYTRITGNTQINRIASAGWSSGMRTRLLMVGALTVKHNIAAGGGFAPIRMRAYADMAYGGQQVLEVTYDATDNAFYET